MSTTNIHDLKKEVELRTKVLTQGVTILPHSHFPVGTVKGNALKNEVNKLPRGPTKGLKAAPKLPRELRNSLEALWARQEAEVRSMLDSDQ